MAQHTRRHLKDPPTSGDVGDGWGRGESSYQIEINARCHLHSNDINKQKIVSGYCSLDIVFRIVVRWHRSCDEIR